VRLWPRSRWMVLWDPLSPGVRILVLVRWPRHLFLTGLDTNGHPQSFATLTEVLRSSIHG